MWHETKVDIMEQICLERAKQQPAFRNALLKTGDKELIHNMEDDDFWGFGPDGNGLHMQGIVLMAVREILQSQGVVISPTPNPLSQPATQPRGANMIPSPQPGQTNSTITKPPKATQKNVIIGDSMVKFLKPYMNNTGEEWDVYPLGGHLIEDIEQKITSILENTDTKSVTYHCGTNNIVCDSMSEIHSKLTSLIWATRRLLPNAHITLSGIIHRLDRPYLNNEIDLVNIDMENLVSTNLSFVDHNPTFRHLDKILNSRGLHLRPVGTRQVANNIKSHVYSTDAKNQAVNPNIKPLQPTSQRSTPTLFASQTPMTVLSSGATMTNNPHTQASTPSQMTRPATPVQVTMTATPAQTPPQLPATGQANTMMLGQQPPNGAGLYTRPGTPMQIPTLGLHTSVATSIQPQMQAPVTGIHAYPPVQLPPQPPVPSLTTSTAEPIQTVQQPAAPVQPAQQPQISGIPPQHQSYAHSYFSGDTTNYYAPQPTGAFFPGMYLYDNQVNQGLGIPAMDHSGHPTKLPDRYHM